MAVKTITVRLPQSTYERLCQLADSLEELPSEMARDILREFIGNFGKTEAKSAGKTGTETKTELSPALKRILGRETQPTEDDKRHAKQFGMSVEEWLKLGHLQRINRLLGKTEGEPKKVVKGKLVN
ncbi:unnamed protein product [marine sediment metagenome]|uniref:Uncharacterized protein n=1 Tax=marine sediment metagenome TaxID=412755 RepID=X1RV31_9ZZZZ